MDQAAASNQKRQEGSFENTSLPNSANNTLHSNKNYRSDASQNYIPEDRDQNEKDYQGKDTVAESNNGDIDCIQSSSDNTNTKQRSKRPSPPTMTASKMPQFSARLGKRYFLRNKTNNQSQI